MMRLFKGQSVQTFCMKQKPIKEGYKFWSTCCAQSGFCWKIISAAHVGNELGRQIINSMLSLIESLPLRDTEKYVCGLNNLFMWSELMIGMLLLLEQLEPKEDGPPKRSSALKMTTSILCIGKMTRTTTQS